MIPNTSIVLPPQTALLLDLGEVGIETLPVPIAMEGIHPLSALPFLFDDLIAFGLSAKGGTALSCNRLSSSC